MKVDSHLTGDWQKIPDHIKQLESDGYDSAGTAEMNHDPFFPLLLAAEHSQNTVSYTHLTLPTIYSV